MLRKKEIYSTRFYLYPLLICDNNGVVWWALIVPV